MPHGNNDLFKVVSAADPNLALTAYGTANGTASGMTNTSAGNVFVSRFTGASNQLWKLESGGCQVSSYAEDISGVTQSKTVSESSTTLQFVCPVENFGDNITWSSSNQAVATVSDDGKVTAKKAGYTTISAYISLDGDEEEYTCDVYVRLANGTYYINNVNNNFCINCLGSIPYENSTLVGSSFYGTSEPTDRGRMFKIKYLGNGCYSVRSMLDNSMGWANVSNKLVMTTIGTSDSSIPANAKWVINSSTRGYYFRIPSTASMAITSPTSSLADITINSLSLSNTSQMWTIKPITASYHGVTIKNKTSNLAVGKSFRFSAVLYSTSNSNYHSSKVNWSVSNGTGSATIDSTTGVLTGVAKGTVNITATYKISAYNQLKNDYTVTIDYGWSVYPQPEINSRSSWGARNYITDRLVNRTRAPERIIFHHSADKFTSTDINDVKAEIKRIQNFHMDNRNKCDIAYHFIIDPAGRIWQGAMIDNYQRGHTTGYYDDIGVLILGDFEPRTKNFFLPNQLNQSQKDAMEQIAKWLCYKYDLPINKANNVSPIETHRSAFSGSECPGENAAPWIEDTLRNIIYDWHNN